MIEYVTPTHEYLDYIARNIRAGDREELRVTGRSDPHEAIRGSAQGSDAAFVALINGEPSAVFGVGTISQLPRVGAPWLLATDVAGRHGRALVRDGRAVVHSWRRHYVLLQNAVSVKNDLSVRWLARLGFSFGAPIKTAFGGHVMVFSMEGDSNV